jgi:hypothetical protein
MDPNRPGDAAVFGCCVYTERLWALSCPIGLRHYTYLPSQPVSMHHHENNTLLPPLPVFNQYSTLRKQHTALAASEQQLNPLPAHCRLRRTTHWVKCDPQSLGRSLSCHLQTSIYAFSTLLLSAACVLPCQQEAKNPATRAARLNTCCLPSEINT